MGALAEAVSTLVASLPAGVVVTDPDAVEKYRYDWSRDAAAGTPVAVVRAEDAEQVQTAVRWAAEHRRAGRAARRRERPVGRVDGGRRRHRGLPRADARGRDRPGLPGRRRPARSLQRRGEGRGGEGGAVVPARPVVVRDLLDRRQHRHQRRWPVLREVRRHDRLRPRARRRAGRRHAGDPRRQADQGRRRTVVAEALRGQRGDARHRDARDPAAGAGAGRAVDPGGDVPLDGGRGRGGRRRTPAAAARR